MTVPDGVEGLGDSTNKHRGRVQTPDGTIGSKQTIEPIQQGGHGDEVSEAEEDEDKRSAKRQKKASRKKAVPKKATQKEAAPPRAKKESADLVAVGYTDKPCEAMSACKRMSFVTRRLDESRLILTAQVPISAPVMPTSPCSSDLTLAEAEQSSTSKYSSLSVS